MPCVRLSSEGFLKRVMGSMQFPFFFRSFLLQFLSVYWRMKWSLWLPPRVPFFHFLKQLKEDVRRIDPQVDEFLKDSETLLDEHELSDQDHRTIELESESLRDRWSKVKEDAKSRESRFVDSLFTPPVSKNWFIHSSFSERVCFSS